MIQSRYPELFCFSFSLNITYLGCANHIKTCFSTITFKHIAVEFYYHYGYGGDKERFLEKKKCNDSHSIVNNMEAK